MFFATWDSEVTDLAAQLGVLRGYQRTAIEGGLPPLAAIDEGSVEPSASALPHFLQSLRSPLHYPVAIDRSGRVADGYGVQDEPWLVLVSARRRRPLVLRHLDVWLAGNERAPRPRSRRHVPCRSRPRSAAVQSLLAGSPPALAAIHRQAGQLLGGRGGALDEAARTARLPGRRQRVGLLVCAVPLGVRTARVRIGTVRAGGRVPRCRHRRLVPATRGRFPGQHPVSYPSYQSSIGALSSIAVIEGLPTTIFIDRAGKVVYVHTGQYDGRGDAGRGHRQISIAS